MFRRYVLVIGILASSVVLSPAQAQTTRAASCESGMWNKLTDEQIAEQKLSERVTAFTDAAHGAQTNQRSKIEIIVIDCPMYGYALRAIKLHNGLSGGSMFSIPETYGLYVTAAYLRNKLEADDVARDARKQVCLIRSGVVDTQQRGDDPQDNVMMKRCMLEEAVVAGDTDYAKWLAKALGVPVPTGRSEIRSQQFSIQRNIDQLNAMPGGVPPGAIKVLEDLRDSFQKK